MADYERSDIHSRRILGTAVGVLTVLAVILGVVYGLYIWLSGPGKAPPGGTQATRELDRRPHLQAHPQQDLASLRRDRQAILESYGWVDRDQGIARIPITRAMALMAEGQGENPPGRKDEGS